MASAPVAPLRITVSNDAPVRASRAYVLYWMTAARRVHFNHALQRAVEWCTELRRPLVVFEPLRVDHRWASERLHRFVLDGMHDNATLLRRHRGVRYLPYVEPEAGAGRGLLAALASNACAVVTDTYPEFFLPRMQAAAAARLDVRMEGVDSNGLLPLGAAPKAYATAAAFRRFLQATLDLSDWPAADPLAGAELPGSGPALDAEQLAPWRIADSGEFERGSPLDALRLDRRVAKVAVPGGSSAARARMDAFVATRLQRYAEERNEPARDAVSGLSPYLHFGHIAAHEIFAAVATAEGWHPGRLANRPNGARRGWWGMSVAAEAFLDQLVTWRELGFNTAHRMDGHDRFETLPAWARQTLAEHEADPRSAIYTYDQLEAAETGDALWNAAQRQLLAEGRIHTYVRMLWGKRVLAWTERASDAYATLVELNNRWALDGRDPNSYSGIAWCFGRYDHPWPVRPVFGSVRAMTSASTGRKFDSAAYIRAWSSGGQADLFAPPPRS